MRCECKDKAESPEDPSKFEVVDMEDDGCGPLEIASCLRPSGETIDPKVLCGAVEACVQKAKRGSAPNESEALLNHELLKCARQGDSEGVLAALQKGAFTETRRPLVIRPESQDDERREGPTTDSMTPLMLASQRGSAECVRVLLKARAEIHAVEGDGWTALHFAAKDCSLEVCKLLLDAKANPRSLNDDQQTPLDLARLEDADFAKNLVPLVK